MLSLSFLKFNKKNIPIFLVGFLSLCYLLFLASSIQPDVFFSGDGGMKFLIVKQINQGQGFKYMYLPQPQWVHSIWNEGYFPFRSPFLYPSSQGYIFSFPPAFQLVSAILYAKFGYLGLYILPLLSALLLWLVVGALLDHFGVSPARIAIVLFVLVFCSPLTIYGAIYWEHMPAVLLLCIGLTAVLVPPGRYWPAIGMGILTGLAVWLRPEALLMNLLYAGAAWVLYRQGRGRTYPGLVVGMAIPVMGFLVFNKLTYGTFLGVHSYQVLQEHGWLYKILKGGYNVLLINWISIQYFPFVLLLGIILYRWLVRKQVVDLPVQLLAGIAVVFCGLAPFMLPNDGGMQWGARYFLPIIPMVLIGLALADKQWGWVERSKPSGWGIAVLGLVAGYAFLLNSVDGGGYKLHWANYHRVKPALDFVKAQDEAVMVVGSGYIPMEMADVFDKKYFFLAEDSTHFHALMDRLKAEGVHEFLYINEEDHSPGLPNLLQHSSQNLVKKGNYFFAKYVVK